MTDQELTPISLAVEGERQLSTNFFWRKDFNGQVFDLQTTVRDNASEEMTAAHIASVLATIGSIIGVDGTAKTIGTPLAATVATLPPAAEAPAASTPAPAPVAAASATPQQAPLNIPDANSFAAELLKVTSVDGQLQFKVFGGKYRKYGVRIWPEVVASALKIEELKPGDYGLTGYVAYFELNESGQPKKVTRLQHTGG